ncbi:MAG: CPBP family intramembrane metalloprotease [Clostridia bacterium]|nr:CPBP family intramembrane metalloprotease [Clostridia bacterium]
MKKMSKRNACLTVALVAIILLVLCEIFCFSCFFGDKVSDSVAQSIDMIATRALGGIAFLAMLVNLDYNILDPLKRPFLRSLVISLPAFAIAINNFPFSQVIKGEAAITGEWLTAALLLLECMCVGFFEETAFRGVVFLGLLRRNPESKVWAFVSIALSSVIFGVVHLINIFESSPIAVLMQIGYSALIGAMCAVILMKTANIWLCVVIHGLFNFCGAVVPRCGEGEIWDAFTVILTVVVSLAVLAYMIVIFVKDDAKTVKRIYE